MASTNPLENNLLLQMISGMGGAIGGEGSLAAGMNAMNQMNIAAQSKVTTQDKYMQMMAKLLGKGVDFKSDAKGKASLSVEDVDTLSGLLSGGNSNSMDSMSGPMASTPAQTQTPSSGIVPTPTPKTFLGDSLNPSSSPLDITSADLAGLTPQDVYQALSGAVSVESLRQSTIANTANRALKARELKSSEALTAAKIKEITPSMNIPGIGKVTSKQYIDWWKTASKDERTAAVKNYEYAQEKGFKGSFEQFQDNSKTTHQKDYAQAKSEGYKGSFNSWMLEMTKAGAINLGDVIAKKGAIEDVEAIKYFSDPKGGLVKDVDKYIKDDRYLDQFYGTPEFAGETSKRKIEYIEGKISGAGAEIVDVTWTGNIVKWKVKFPNGTVEEITNAVGPRPTK